MRNGLIRWVLYTALALGANAAVAQDMAAAEAAREGTMKKLVFHSEPKAVEDVPFGDLSGGTHSLSDYKGQVVVLNFWATWCAPCRHEMPMLSNLQETFAGKNVEVVTIATGRNMPAAINRFFDEIEVDNLPSFVDPKQALARKMSVFGLPVTVILDAEGREVARMQGDAEWDSESAVAVLEALIPASVN
ncbi:TlpA family protein disulfide reductase [Alphaproteobacteria bacterium KMM 3653]|uniref:TlpA family protein disulfide reductase n=1 Tax=Harenicola maris TaxID=2841044 RepID=A0AAP2GAH9_9RHOB|nr:TlpA family protein disulfide reductase [Harenicola maris]